MKINEHDKKEIKGCMKLLETIKDTSRDYVGTNGCLYQDITREELNLIVNEIKRLNNIINELEIWLEEVDIFQRDIENISSDHITVYNVILDKLKELKRSDTNENS